jgi:predicted ATPase
MAAVGTNRLVGRGRELATLRSFLGAAAGDGATLLLTGEPGVGKTALLVAAAEMAAADGVRVIRGAGVEYETDVSFAGLHQLVDPLSEDLRRLPPSSRAAIEVALGIGSGPAPDRLAVLSASLALFRQAASSTPLLVVIDDLHWLDRATGAVMASSVGGCGAAASDCSARSGPASAASSNAPGCRSSTSRRS